MPLYQFKNNGVSQIKPSGFSKERELQKLFEANSEELLGVKCIASEFTTGDRQRGRIDTLGLDQDGYPTIIEYKKNSKENIINQGLFYLDWLVDHKGDFTLAVQQTCGAEAKIDWSHPRLVLVAENFSEYDKYAVNRIGANIELWVFRKYGDDLLYLDPLFTASPQPTKGTAVLVPKEPESQDETINEIEVPTYTISDHTHNKPVEIIQLFEQLRELIIGLAGEDEIAEKANKMYVGYKHGKNFCEVRLQTKFVVIWLDIAVSELDDPYHLARDVSKVGHYGTGDGEIKVVDASTIEQVMSLIEQSYRQTI